MISKPSYQQPKQQSLGGRQESWRQARLLAERDKFAQHVMVSAGVCFGGKRRLHFVDESAKVDFAYLVGRLLPSLVNDCTRLLPSGYIFQQDGAPAHTAQCHAELAPNQLPRFRCQRPVASKFTRLELLGLPCLGAMLEAYNKRHLKPKTIAELKEVLQVIWDSLPQRPIGKAVKEFSKRLKACVAADGGYFEHSQ